MAQRQVFYSFHFANDVLRVQLIRNIGALEDNKPASKNKWEEVKRDGDAAIRTWIHDNMANRSCVVVLIGEETANRKWVKHEIKKAWRDGRGLLGIYVHNLNDPNTGTAKKGPNPFTQFTFEDDDGNVKSIPCKNPPANNAYNHIRANLPDWIEEAIANRQS